MAWKRGTTNQQAGAIRKGQIKEFQEPSSRQTSVSSPFKVVAAHLPNDSTFALLSAQELPSVLQPYVTCNGEQQLLFLHSHKHPRTVLRVHLVDSLTPGQIALTEAQRINSKVCIGEDHEWTVYQGDTYAFDAREGAIGDTEVRSSSRQAPPVLSRVVIHVRPRYHGMTSSNSSGSGISSSSNASVTDSTGDDCKLSVDARAIIRRFSSILQGCIVSTEDIYCCNTVLGIDEGKQHIPSFVVSQDVPESDDHISLKDPQNVFNIEMEVVGRIAEVVPVAVEDEEDEEEEEEEKDVGMEIEGSSSSQRKAHIVLEDLYRGIVGEDTDIFVLLENNDITWILTHAPPIPSAVPLKNIVTVYTNDDQEFPVHRRLLRPCIALTSVVQLGKGKYRYDTTMQSKTNTTATTSSSSGSSSHHDTTMNSNMSEGVSVNVDVDACTFDKVLLYLEHEARGDPFKFDPLIATELRDAAIILGVVGLKELCDKVLGSFQERVRKTPITFAEVRARNLAGTQGQGLAPEGTKGGTTKRGDTWLLLDGMVLDITRWLPEHPGGSEIIPKQSLNVDATVFFEIYHASRQSFLYLKEFYIGELAMEDRPLVPQPSPDLNAEDGNIRSNPSSITTTQTETKSISLHHQVTASPAFLEQLKKYTTWRLKVEDMQSVIVNHKSF